MMMYIFSQSLHVHSFTKLVKDSTPNESSTEAADQVEVALAAIPPRSITGESDKEN